MPIQNENWISFLENLIYNAKYQVELNANNELCCIIELFYDPEKQEKRLS